MVWNGDVGQKEGENRHVKVIVNKRVPSTIAIDKFKAIKNLFFTDSLMQPNKNKLISASCSGR